MRRISFDRLHTVRLVQESRNGCTEICRGPDGALWVKLGIGSAACQREFLNGLGEPVPTRLEGGVLEVLLPCYEGVSLREWLYEQKPTLGQRRDACLSLLEQQITRKLPPFLTALSANIENLTVTGSSMFLQYLPELRRWEPGMDEARSVCAVAGVICEVLVEKSEPWRGERMPEELLLLTLRQRERDYANWGQLQRDVAAIPDAMPRRNFTVRPHIQRIGGCLYRYGKYVLRALVALLFTAALLSLASAYRRHTREENAIIWQGMAQVGSQDLRNEGDGE